MGLILIEYFSIFIFGIIVGSFLNVCIYRLPLEESIVTGPSHCMSCKTKIKRYDLIPVLSYIILGGRCRNCKTPISIRYPLIELFNGLVWVLTAFQFGMTIKTLLVAFLMSALIVVGFMDWDTQLINIPVCVIIAILGIARIIFVQEQNIVQYLLGGVIISVPLLLIYLISKGKAMGGGDIYFMAATGLFLGFKLVLLATFLGVVSGAITGVVIKYVKKTNQIAFGPFLSLGVATAALYGEQIFSWYINLLN